MAFGSLGGNEDNQPMAEINMVPMIDVMLVLLIIFIVTAPLLTHAVKLELPRASSSPNLTPQSVQVAIDAAGKIFWNGEEVDKGALQQRLQTASTEAVEPEIHLSIDRTTAFEKVAEVMSMASSLGLSKLAFVTDPTPAPK
ncbi:MAG: biopolymer transporter ExbD [Proteobacteria bacterium]|nr:MAG: biopolymer transporter ExbD [Pseudomonadota bacterium]